MNNTPLDEQWKLPLTLAITVHLLVFGSALIPSSFFNSRPKNLDIQTVSLFNANEMNAAMQGGAAGKPAAKPEPPKPAAKEPEPPKPEPKAEPKPEPKEEAIPIPEPEPPKPEPKAVPKPVEKPVPPPVKAISIAPKNEKTKVVDPKQKAKEEALKEQAIDKLKDKLREKEAVKKAQDKLANLRDLLHTSKPAASAPAPPTSKPLTTGSAGAGAAGSNSTGLMRNGGPGAGGGSIIVDLALRNYYASIQGRISQFWILPEIQNWDEKLEAIVFLTIRRDGVITKSSFEQKTNNVYFNRFIEKTIQEASPLPPFPPEIKESEMEIGFRFRPSGLY